MAWVMHPKKWNSIQKKFLTTHYFYGEHDVLASILTDNEKFCWNAFGVNHGIADSLIEAKEKTTSALMLYRLTK